MSACHLYRYMSKFSSQDVVSGDSSCDRAGRDTAGKRCITAEFGSFVVSDILGRIRAGRISKHFGAIHEEVMSSVS